jgi:hypothetical protein
MFPYDPYGSTGSDVCRFHSGYVLMQLMRDKAKKERFGRM